MSGPAVSTQQRILNLVTFAYQTLLVCWICGSVFLIGRLMFFGQLLFRAEGNQIFYIDYILYQMAGKLFLSDKPNQIYDAAAQLQCLNSLIAPLSFTSSERFATAQLYYPPFFFALMSPFAVLPTTVAYVLWTLLCLGGCLWATSAMVKQNAALSKRQQILFLAGSLVFLPFSQSVQIGYSSLLLLAMVAGYFVFFEKKRDIMAGIFLALTAVKIQYIWALFIPALIMRRWKVMFSAIAGIVVLFGLSALRIGIDTVLNYPQSLLHAEHATNINQMVNFRGLFFNVLPQSLVLPATAVAGVCGGVFLLYVWFVASRNDNLADRHCEHWAIALTAVCCLLFSPHVTMSDCTLLIIAAAYTMPTIAFAVAWKLRPLSLTVWCMTILFSPIISVALFVWWSVLNHWWSMGLDPFAIYNLILFVSGSIYFCQTFSKDRNISTAVPQEQTQ